MRKNIELLANIAIIVATIAFVAVLIHRFYFPLTSDSTQLKVGSKVLLPDIKWEEHNKNLVLVLQKGCRFCEESKEFYKRLIPAAKEKNVLAVAVLPSEPEESKKYLSDLGLPVVETKKVYPDTINVRGTPTLILANDHGDIIQFWVGKLNPEQEDQVLGSL